MNASDKLGKTGKPPDVWAMAQNSPDELTERLSVSDMVFWEAVKAQVLAPCFMHGQAFLRHMKAKNIEFDDIYRHVYEKMVNEGKLKALRKREYVCNFILDYAKSYVLNFHYGSDNVMPPGQERKKWKRRPKLDLKQPLSDENNAGMDQYPQEDTGVPNDEDLPEEVRSAYESLRSGLDRYWAKTPCGALAFLLRNLKGLSSREVTVFLNVVTENYVNQVVHVAKGYMQKTTISISEALGRGKPTSSSRGKVAKRRKENAYASEFPGKPLMVAFEARLPRDHGDWWCACMAIDDISIGKKGTMEDSGKVSVWVSDRYGDPLDGKLVLRDLRMPVVGGAASCSLGRLRAAIVTTDVSFCRTSSGAIAGTLMIL